MPQMIQAVKGPIHAKITIPGSKSITHRALLIAALADGVSELSALWINDEIKIMVSALSQLGIVIQLDEKARSCIIAGGSGKFPKKQATVWCGNSALITNFLLAACASTPGVYFFDGSQTLRERTLYSLLNILYRQGAQFIPSDKEKLPLTLVGADSLEGGDVLLDSSITSMLISALLLIAPYARSAFNYTLVDLHSEPYIDMTCTMMAEFGVLVHRVHQGQFMIPVPQRYQSKEYKIEPDFAFAAYFFGAAAVTGGELTIQTINYHQIKQSQVKLLAILEKMGCKLIENTSGFIVKGAKELQGTEVTLRNFADVFVVLAAIAPFAKTPTHILHAGPLQVKEQLLFYSLKNQLHKMGIKFEAGEDWIKIYPSTPKGITISPNQNHRIAMGAAIIGLKTPNMVIENTESVTRLYPEFFSLWEKLAETVSACA